METQINSNIEIRWTVSCAKSTYGYNICSLWEAGKKVASCKGGGFDMPGTVLGNWLKLNYASRIEKLYAPKFFGLIFVKKRNNRDCDCVDASNEYKYLKKYSNGCRISLDGSCGWSNMEKVAGAIGLTIKQDYTSEKLQTYTVIDRKGAKQ